MLNRPAIISGIFNCSVGWFWVVLQLTQPDSDPFQFVGSAWTAETLLRGGRRDWGYQGMTPPSPPFQSERKPSWTCVVIIIILVWSQRFWIKTLCPTSSHIYESEASDSEYAHCLYNKTYLEMCFTFEQFLSTFMLLNECKIKLNCQTFEFVVI